MKRMITVLVLAALICITWITPPIYSKETVPTLQESAPDIALNIPGANQVQIKMRLIPAGVFLMGSPADEMDRDCDEGPQRQIVISEPFYVGIYEVTQAQWAAVMGTYPSKFSYIPENPVEQISWDDCQEFIAKLNEMEIGVFRLPTEAEWEYACRAGSITRYPWGNDPDYCGSSEYACSSCSASGKTNLVGQKKPNDWGLFDMHGNVLEWCSDWYAASYDIDDVTDPKGPCTGSYRVVRGGGWYYDPQYCRSAYRLSIIPGYMSSGLGFRLVRIALEKAPSH